MAMKFRCASAIERLRGAARLPKLHGRLNHPFVDAELGPDVASVGLLVRLMAPATRA